MSCVTGLLCGALDAEYCQFLAGAFDLFEVHVVGQGTAERVLPSRCCHLSVLFGMGHRDQNLSGCDSSASVGARVAIQ